MSKIGKLMYGSGTSLEDLTKVALNQAFEFNPPSTNDTTNNNNNINHNMSRSFGRSSEKFTFAKPSGSALDALMDTGSSKALNTSGTFRATPWALSSQNKLLSSAEVLGRNNRSNQKFNLHTPLIFAAQGDSRDKLGLSKSSELIAAAAARQTLKRSAGSSPPAQTASSLSRESIRALDPNTRFAFSDSPASSFSAFPIANGARKRTLEDEDNDQQSNKRQAVPDKKKAGTKPTARRRRRSPAAATSSAATTTASHAPWQRIDRRGATVATRPSSSSTSLNTKPLNVAPITSTRSPYQHAPPPNNLWTPQLVKDVLQSTIAQRANPMVRQVTTRAGVRGSFVDITDFLALPQNDAADMLGLPTSTLSKRWKETVQGRKWPFRTVQKLDKEIEGVLETQSSDEAFAADDLPTIRHLMKQRADVLQPVHIRISKLDKLRQNIFPPEMQSKTNQRLTGRKGHEVVVVAEPGSAAADDDDETSE